MSAQLAGSAPLFASPLSLIFAAANLTAVANLAFPHQAAPWHSRQNGHALPPLQPGMSRAVPMRIPPERIRVRCPKIKFRKTKPPVGTRFDSIHPPPSQQIQSADTRASRPPMIRIAQSSYPRQYAPLSNGAWAFVIR